MQLSVLAGQSTHHNRVLPTSTGTFLSRFSTERIKKENRCGSRDKDHEIDEHFFQQTIDVNCALCSGYFDPHILSNKWLGTQTEGPRRNGFEPTTD
jgi:hypothetical protein